MKVYGDFHTHTSASDGRASSEKNIAYAKAAELSFVALTDHSFDSLYFHQTEAKFDAQSEAVKAASVGDLKVFHGVEANLAGSDGSIDVPEEIIGRCDVLLLGFHRFLNHGALERDRSFFKVNGWGDKADRSASAQVRINTDAIIKAMSDYPVDVLCHLNHRMLVNMTEVARAAAELGVYIELNEKHIWALESGINAATAAGARFILGSDAHKPSKIGRFPETEIFITSHGIPTDAICGASAAPPRFRNKKDWKRL